MSELAVELGVSHWNLRDWTKGGDHKKVASPSTQGELQRELARLRRENQKLEARCEVLKKSVGHPCRTIPERFARMKALQADYAIGDLCAAFEVSRSGYHRWRTAQVSARRREDALLSLQLRTLHAQSRGTYGRPRLCAALRKAGRCHSPKRIGRLMRTLGLSGVRRGRFRPQTTQSGHGLRRVSNRMLGAPPTSHRDQLWVADITFVPTAEGWLYVAGVPDRHSRRVLGLAFSARIDSSVPEAALRQAFARRGGRVGAGLLHHSDQGLQYASGSYQALLQTQAITPSMSRKANCYDNAHMESFWATLKAEALAERTFATREQARLAIFDYIETFSNRVRLHSALGYQSPVDFEQLTN